MMAKHTPGPWDVPTIGYVRQNGCLLPVAPDETRLPGESWLDMRKRISPELKARESECLANAKLISAAPDLLAACQEFCRKVDAGEARSKRSYAQMAAAIEKAIS